MSSTRLSCAEAEVMLADYVDRTLLDRDVAVLKAHLAECPGCRELAADSAMAVEFMDRAAVVEPPPELVNRILFEIGHGAPLKAPWQERVFGGRLRSVLQPRFAMGMAMTMLSLGMLLGLGRAAHGPDWTPLDLFTSAEDSLHRQWDRGVKYYQNLKIVFEIQSRYQEWAAERKAQPAQPEPQNQKQPGQPPKGQQ
jgi:hypothetical protein